MITFAQFGCCVCRDIFNFLDESEYVPVYSHNAVNILNMINENNLNILDEDITADDNFSKRMQKLSFCHPNLRTYLKDKVSDYFIFDLGEERLPLQTWEQNGNKAQIPVTWGTYRTSLNVLKNNNYKVKISDWHLSDRDINEFCETILEKYDQDHIIYISIRQAKEFINKEKYCISNFENYEGKGIEKLGLRNRQDEVINHAEKMVHEFIPNLWEIVIPSNYLADDRHILGRHTLHFNHIVYEYFSECVKLITSCEGASEEQKIKVYRAIDFRKKIAEIKLDDMRHLYLNENIQ